MRTTQRTIVKLLLLVCVYNLYSQTVTWTGEVNDLWSESGNWDIGLPGPADEVIIPANALVLADISSTIRKLVLSGSLTIDDDVEFLINGNQMENSGLVNDNGIIENHGVLNIANTQGHGIRNINGGSIINYASMYLDNIQGNAIHNVLSELENIDDDGSSIRIDNTMGFGIYNDGGNVQNNGEIKIGEQALTMGVQEEGILNRQEATFFNSGNLLVDNSYVNGIRNEDDNTLFENHGHVQVMMRTNPDSDGVINAGEALMTSFLGSTLSVLKGERHIEGPEYPFHLRGDLAIAQLSTSEPIVQGVYFDIMIDIQNIGAGVVDSAELMVVLNNQEIAVLDIPSLQPDEIFQITHTHGLESGGKFLMQVEVLPNDELQDVDLSNNFAEQKIYVDGDSDAFISLEFIEPDLPEEIIPGTSLQVVADIKNEGFTVMENFDIKYYIDGELLLTDQLSFLDPDEMITYEFDWLNIESGEHIITAEARSLTDPTLVYTKSWIKIVKNATFLYQNKDLDKWVSIGPRILNNGDVGRVDCIAVHPSDSNIIYVGATLGGLWKTTDGGQNWIPLTDKLPVMRVGAIALDPKNPDIIYCGTGSSLFRGGAGIFKSIDGGTNWCQFMRGFTTLSNSQDIINGIHDIVIEYQVFNNYPLPPDKDFAIFIATDKGIIRHYSSDSSALSTTYNEWDQILNGRIMEMHFTPILIGEVFASVYKKGLYKTNNAYGANVTSADWTNLNAHFNLVDSSRQTIRMDIFPYINSTLIAAINFPTSDFSKTLKIFKSVDGGSSWTFVKYGFWENRNYIDFIRFDPFNQNSVYYGGIRLYKDDLTSTGSPSFKKVGGIHDDQKALIFDQHRIFKYYGLSDGGIYRCERNPSGSDQCQNLNNNLRVTMFFDFDVSSTKADLIVGGTQDNGTILYSGSADWKQIRGGDGKFSLVGSGDNKVFYSQHQYLNESQVAMNCLTQSCSWNNIAANFPGQKNGVLFRGTQDSTGGSVLTVFNHKIFHTPDKGMNWDTVAIPNEKVTWITLHPTSHNWFAGTSSGRVFQSSNQGTNWDSVHTNSSKVLGGIKKMVFSIVDPDILYLITNNPRTARLIDSAGVWSVENISKGLPLNPICIAGDGYDANVAYVGTDKGVFQWNANLGHWKAYNQGFPLTKVMDLLVNPISKEIHAATWGRGAWTVVTGNE